MLKKCIVIMVMFTLVAGAAFAQVTFGGQLQEGVTLFSGNNVKDTDVNMGGGYSGDGPFHEAKFSALFGDGTAGGRLVLNVKGSYWGWMQWRPNQFFRVKIGSDGDGEGGFPQIVGWGFTGEAKNSVAAVSDYAGPGISMKYRNNGLNYGAFDGAGDFNFMVSVFPTDLLQINLLSRNIDKEGEISAKLAKLQIFASFKIEEVGTIRFAAVGNGGLEKDAPDGSDIGTLWLAFYSNEIVQGLAFEVGANFNLPHLEASDTYSNMNVAAGINLTSTDPFNLKLRMNAAFGGKAAGEDLTPGFGFGILPSYKLPKMTIFFHAGMGLEFPDGEDTVYTWFINPYIWVPMGGMRMWVGLQILDEHAANDGQFGWKIPFGFNFYF